MHIHTDFIAAAFAVLAVAVGFHAMRAGGGWLAAHGAPRAGKLVAGVATFN